MTGLVTAGVGLVVGAGVAAYSAYNQNQVAGQELGMAQTTQGEQEYYNSLLQQLIANPSSVSSLPGFQFQLQTGSEAVADRMAASGFAGSGNEAAALTSFGQGLASSFYGQQTSLLASLSGVTNASSPSQSAAVASSANSASSQQLSSLLNSLGFYGTLASKYGSAGASAGTPAGLGYSSGSTGGTIGADAS